MTPVKTVKNRKIFKDMISVFMCIQNYIFIRISISFIPIKGAKIPPKPKISKFRVNAAFAEIGLYRTPFRARGMSKTMIIALKMTALRIALWGEPRFIIFNAESGPTPLLPE
jgi:hypothetical protein